MKYAHRFEPRFAIALASVVGLVASQPLAGDLERFCRSFVGNCSGFFEITERYVTVPPAGVPWTIVAYSEGAGSQSVAPGMPGCPTATTAPGYESLVAAAASWTTSPPPSDPCEPPGFEVIQGSTFGFAAVPTVATISTLPTAQNPTGLVGTNPLTFWAHPSYFGPGGASATLAITNVGVQQVIQGGTTPGNIVGFEILFNARSTAWSWFEQNLGTPGLAGKSFASFPGASFAPPVTGYADIWGVAVHEFGHAAGLGHSLIDSEAAATTSYFPTMFDRAQPESFSATIEIRNPAGCGFVANQAVNGSQTSSGGIYGRSARTLAPDDRAAICRGYPSAAFTTATGEIRGTITSQSFPANGVSVVAVSAACPDRLRVGTLSYGFASNGAPLGSYSLSGLPPGDYYVYVERPDQPLSGGTAPGFYFDPWTMPSYLAYVFGIWFSAPHPTIPNCTYRHHSCANPARFYTELYDSREGTEPFTQLASLVTVVAGTSVVRDIQVEIVGAGAPTHPVLEVSLQGPTPVYSTRGISLPGSTAPPPTWTANSVRLRVRADPAKYSGRLVDLYLATQYELSTIVGQLKQVQSVAGGAIPGTLTGQIDGSGICEWIVPLSPAELYDNVLCQAVIHPLVLPIPPADPELKLDILTNVVNVWIWTHS